jgi:hypothetical protein
MWEGNPHQIGQRAGNRTFLKETLECGHVLESLPRKARRRRCDECGKLKSGGPMSRTGSTDWENLRPDGTRHRGDPSEEEIAEHVVSRIPHAPICSAQWHLREVERIITETEEREAATISGKYGTDELHDCKIALWKLMDKMPEDL